VKKERILITVRTYPTISTRYVETVCTGGINDCGEWRRIYPVPLRYLEEDRQFTTFDIVEMALKDGDDGRMESRKPGGSINIVGHVDDWSVRCQWVNPTICPSLAAMSSANRTLAPVAVKQVLEFLAEPCSAEWTQEQKDLLKQELMFGERKPLEKIPFEFRLRWQDEDGEEHNSLILAWEMYETWRSYRRDYPNPVEVMRDKFMSDIFGPARKLSLFMGNHSRFRDIWMICGWFFPPREQANNESLFGS
jgi:hypothetical protein